MKSPKQFIWKWRMALLILAIAWIGIDELAIPTTAEVRPPRRKRRVMISPQELQKKDSTQIDVGNSLVEIARRASRQTEYQIVDLVLVIDGSEGMKPPVAAIEKRLVDMVSAFEESVIDYRLGLIWFQNVKGAPQITVHPLQSGLSTLEKSIRHLPMKFSDARAGYGLDAILQGLSELVFRSNAEKHMILVTNSALRTSWGMKDGRNQLVGKILEGCHQDEIHINVIGLGEELQVQLADETGGKWYPIDKNQTQIDQAPMIDRSILKIEGVFKRIAQHIAATVKSAADIVFVFDASLSMESKVDKICTGVDEMVDILDAEGTDYRFGLIRFWSRVGGGESSVVLTKPPLDAKQIKWMFRLPKRGDEHLLDAIMEGVRKLKTPADRQLVLFIVTDEGTSRRQDKGYTSARAIEVCRRAKAQVNVIGGVSSISGRSFSDDFQRRVAEVTRGKYYIMPGSTIADKRW
ncbi:MAG: VWA domain-containing protein [Candidatus Poribacteria bacterium]|nr:VWA domain-containing protein [Candidatus Poribacteria bacterium]